MEGVSALTKKKKKTPLFNFFIFFLSMGQQESL
jgi:hypothetical protein